MICCGGVFVAGLWMRDGVGQGEVVEGEKREREGEKRGSYTASFP